VNLRQANTSEFDLVFDVLYENATWLLSKGIFQWPLDWLESIRCEIKSSIDQGLFFVAEIQDEFAAVVEIRSAPEEIWKNNAVDALYIHKLAICRKYADRGLGVNVINQIKHQAIRQNIDYLRLDCVAHNDKLREYYESCGFKLKGIVDADVVNLALFEHQIHS
jgi:ribosomal protein S18 acetylase RimI-like enzyme